MIDASFEGAQVLRPSGLELGAVHVAGGRLVEARQERRVILPPGSLILPGIIDIHGDGFERHLAPRRGAMRDLGAGLLATEAELAANGITTAMLASIKAGLARLPSSPPKRLPPKVGRARRRLSRIR